MSFFISFLNTLNIDDFNKIIPQKAPSGLAVSGNIHGKLPDLFKFDQCKDLFHFWIGYPNTTKASY